MTGQPAHDPVGDKNGVLPIAPCQCHDSFAYISPWHPGHCCFWPPNATCHSAEVAAWEAERDRRRPRVQRPRSTQGTSS